MLPVDFLLREVRVVHISVIQPPLTLSHTLHFSNLYLASVEAIKSSSHIKVGVGLLTDVYLTVPESGRNVLKKNAV